MVKQSPVSVMVCCFGTAGAGDSAAGFFPVLPSLISLPFRLLADPLDLPAELLVLSPANPSHLNLTRLNSFNSRCV